MNKLTFLILCIVGIVGLQMGFIFLLLALLPSIVIFNVNIRGKKDLFKIVGSCNLAAALPIIVPMFRDGLAMRHYRIEPVMADPAVWLRIYLGAAAGWMMIYLARIISQFIVMMLYEYRIRTLKKAQKRLVDEWGPQISG